MASASRRRCLYDRLTRPLSHMLPPAENAPVLAAGMCRTRPAARFRAIPVSPGPPARFRAHAQHAANKPTSKSGVPAITPAAPPPASAAPARTPGAGRSALSPERLDGIAAVVNDDVILQSDVEEQLYLFLSQARVKPDSAM